MIYGRIRDAFCPHFAIPLEILGLELGNLSCAEEWPHVGFDAPFNDVGGRLVLRLQMSDVLGQEFAACHSFNTGCRDPSCADIRNEQIPNALRFGPGCALSLKFLNGTKTLLLLAL